MTPVGKMVISERESAHRSVRYNPQVPRFLSAALRDLDGTWRASRSICAQRRAVQPASAPFFVGRAAECGWRLARTNLNLRTVRAVQPARAALFVGRPADFGRRLARTNINLRTVRAVQPASAAFFVGRAAEFGCRLARTNINLRTEACGSTRPCRVFCQPRC